MVDLVYGAGLVGLLTLAVAVGLEAHALLVAFLPMAPAMALAACGAMLAWVAVVALVSALVPRPQSGKFKVLGHPAFFYWTLAFVLRRWLAIPPLHTVIFQSAILRYAVLRLLGARVAFTTNMSSDVLVLDPALFSAGPGCVLGSQMIVSGHLIIEQRLLLAPVRLGRRTEIGARSVIGPGVSIGDDVRVGIAVTLGTNVTIEDGASIGPHAMIDQGVKIGKRARVIGDTYIPPFTELPEGAVWTGEDAP